MCYIDNKTVEILLKIRTSSEKFVLSFLSNLTNRVLVGLMMFSQDLLVEEECVSLTALGKPGCIL